MAELSTVQTRSWARLPLRWLACCGLALSLHIALPLQQTAWAGEAALLAENPEQEARMMTIASELRCLVCQNQTIADSHSGLAGDLRQEIREQLQRGQNEQQIRDYMTARYGNFILYRPPVDRSTALLWFGPGLLAVGGLAFLWWTLRRRSRMQADAFDPDTPDQPDEP
ncbi:MAG: cytochrome c-type biogenesis protein CcmH [Aquabacterium sp.]|uniref:cytochrome c-type biogenesis protein n=1 Tax=Aquabacterium sp. TaxID=1872578 RepID=UPI0011FE8A5F|nr:cytochrome c-type biogenesis protein [Aquabacterium sp.]TAK94177.1 MAG: cytochrome c-type biogenesis protein CcmH [Aquabacterium sp.]